MTESPNSPNRLQQSIDELNAVLDGKPYVPTEQIPGLLDLMRAIRRVLPAEQSPSPPI